MCFFGSGLRVRVFFSSSGFRDKMFLLLAQVPYPGVFLHWLRVQSQGAQGLWYGYRSAGARVSHSPSTSN